MEIQKTIKTVGYSKDGPKTFTLKSDDGKIPSEPLPSGYYDSPAKVPSASKESAIPIPTPEPKDAKTDTVQPPLEEFGSEPSTYKPRRHR